MTVFWRTIQITRSSTEFTAEDGLHATEISVATDVPADIQFKSSAVNKPLGFPGPTNSDTPMNIWKIFCQLPLGTVKKGDKLVDDLGDAYTVDAAWHNGIMYELIARDLQP